MAKTSVVERDTKRRRMAKSLGGKRKKLKAIIMDRDTGRSKGFGFVEMSSLDEAEKDWLERLYFQSISSL